ncbi:MAG: RelA/SpoT family protein, partial [Bacteroidales bacterium]|nr:RelA/SpoT family protein [Bacteroidales bacterium]
KTLESLEVKEPQKGKEKAEDFLIIDEKVANVDYKLSQCCNPVLGDNVFGFVTINEGIKIHRTNCPNAANMIARYGYRVVKAKWTRKGPEPVFPVDIKISGEDQDGILTRISEALARDSAVNIRSFNLNADEGEFSGIIKITVRDLEHLDWLIGNLSKIKGIYSVGRVEGSRS